MAAHLDALLRGGGPESGGGPPPAAFDTAGFVSEALDALSLEQLRAWLLSRLEATRSEVRRAPPSSLQGCFRREPRTACAHGAPRARTP